MADVVEKSALPQDILLLPQPSGADNAPIELPEYTWEEILKHNKPRDLWIVVGGNIYNVGEFMFHHPGGAEVYLKNHGKDATSEFLQVGHPPYAMALTASFLIGKVKDGSRPPDGAEPQGGGATDEGHANLGEPVAHGDGEDTVAEPREIPVAVPLVKLDGERFVNFDILNDLPSQLRYYQQLGHVYQAPLPNGRRLVMVSDPDLLEEVAENDELFGKEVEGINFYKQLAEARGGGISVIGDSPTYQKIRRVMLPWYSPQQQRTQFPRMKEVAHNTAEAWSRIPTDTPIDMRDWAIRYSLEISGRGACNYDFRLLDPAAEKSDFARALPECLREGIARVAEPHPDKFPWIGGDPEKKTRSQKFHQQAEVLFETAGEIVRTRANMAPTEKQTDLLSRLLTEPDPDTGELLPLDTMRDQVLMHLSNGFNGPSATLTWIAYTLATRPDIEQKVLDEIDSIAGGDPDYDLQYADLMNLKYVTQVIKEALRVYPPLPVTMRNVLKEGQLGPWAVRKGDIILVGTLAAHRDPRYWGPTPDVFDPEHFTLERVATRHRHAFIPFSVGIRQCMAQEVSFMMLRVGIFALWNRYRLRIAPGSVVKATTVVSLQPIGVQLVREDREGRPERAARLALLRAIAPKAATAPIEEGKPPFWDVPCEVPESSPYRDLVVAFGSNFGSTKDLAERLAEKGHQLGFTSEVMPLNALVERFDALRPRLLIVATPTYTGNPPTNANHFKAWLQKERPSETWRNVRYLVWGLGNSSWNAFLAFPKFVDQRLRELGAQPLSAAGFGDVNTPTWEDVFRAWSYRAWPPLVDLAGAKPSPARAKALKEVEEQRDSLTSVDSAAALIQSLAGNIVAPTILTNALEIQTVPATLVESRELHGAGATTSTRHLELTLPEGIVYHPGDHLGVCPENDSRLVQRLARLVDVPLDGVFVVPRSMSVRSVPRGMTLQVRNTLTHLLDIAAAPTPQLLGALAAHCAVEDEKETLLRMADVLRDATSKEEPSLREHLLSGSSNVVELLDRFRGVDLNFFELLEITTPLRPRYYSTCSSPRIHGQGVAHLTVGRLVRPLPGEGGKAFEGVSSRYLCTRQPGDTIHVFVDLAEGFHLQEDVALPMIFVSAGTGFAPMRAFLWERQANRDDGVPLGKALLFNGIRRSTDDFIYREELERFKTDGVLDDLHVALSREIAGTVEYVQHKLLERSVDVWELLQQGAYVYVCGSQAMRSDVRQAFVQIVEREGRQSHADADGFLTKLEAEQRYRPDVWG